MRAIAVIGLCALLSTASCESGEPEPLPPGAGASEEPVVARVNGVDITREELAQAARFAAHITRLDATERHLQRVALRDMLLPRAAIAAQDLEGRAAARERAEAVRETLLDGMPGPQPPSTSEVEIVRAGELKTFGPFVLGVALDLEPGAWSDPIEGFGIYHLVRLVELPVEGSAPSITLGVIDFPFHALTQAPDELLARSELEILDPALHEIIPAALRHRMTGNASLSRTSD